jgi:ubiquinol-cytochrome c reductase cytochrome b subunit
VLVIPGIILALISAHMGILWHQKHTDFPGAGKSNRVIAGSRLFPQYAMKSAGFFFLVFGMVAALAGLAQINPVWMYGPYEPSVVSAASQPDWYVGWLDGSLRLMLPYEFRGAGVTIPFEVFLPAVVLPLLLFGLMALYPAIEARVTGDRAQHNELDLPRDHPVRTGIGLGAVTFYLVLLFAGGEDVLATTFGVSLNAIVWALRILLILAPAAVFTLTYNWCRGLQQDDDDELIEGRATGTILQEPGGEFVEVHAPVPFPEVPDRPPGDPEEHLIPSTAPPDTAGYHARALLRAAGRGLGRFFTDDRNGAVARVPVAADDVDTEDTSGARR